MQLASSMLQGMRMTSSAGKHSLRRFRRDSTARHKAFTETVSTRQDCIDAKSAK